MKKLFGLLVAAIALTLNPTSTKAATNVLEIKPGATNVVIASFHNGVGLSFKIEKTVSTNAPSDLQKIVFATDESAFQEIVLQGKTNVSEVRQKLDVLAAIQRAANKEKFSETFENPFLFGKPFAFTNAPAGPVSLVIGLVRENASAGDYLVTVSDSKVKKVSEQRLRVVPEYRGHVLELIGEMHKVEKSLAEVEEFRAILGEIDQATKGIEEASKKLRDKTRR